MSRLLPGRALTGVLLSLVVALGAVAPASAVNTVTTANNLQWQVHDAAAPALDSGSIRAITGNAFFGFGSIKVGVSGIPSSDPSGRFNGEMMRGFGLRFDGVDTFDTTKAVTLGGVDISREVFVNKPGNYVRWLDSFTNTSTRVVTVDVSFGGTAGYNAGTNVSQVVATSSGDTLMGPDDSWVEVAASGAAGPTPRGPSAVVTGTPSPFSGALTGMGNHQRQPFTNPMPATGLDSNFYGYRNTLTISPGQTKSLLHFVVAGTTESAGNAGTQITAVRNTATTLAGTPNLAGLSTGRLCTVANFDIATTPGFDSAACASAQPPQPASHPEPAWPKTSSPYDVLDKSITQLQADMESGATTSQEITRAYLDRIAAYDTGAFGFHTFITVAQDAMAQAHAADQARADGARGDLLGIPVAVKDLYDTKDMPTTDGSLALEGWRPARDAFQVARMRAAGAVILGKTNLSEFANSGSYSDSGYMMTWNAFKPSKTSLGSSGGSAVATALSFAGFSMGTQTGVSLYAPSTGASLVTLRGTDGISSGSGVMPLTYLQDFEGPIARTTSDIARILNVTTGTDPNDPATVHADADAKRPADWKTALDAGALEGKRIGYIPASFEANLSYGQDDGTSAALQARFADIEAAGATMVPITAPVPSSPPNPTLTGNRTEEGWQHYWSLQDNPPFTTASGILSSPRVLPYNRGTTPVRARFTDADVQAVMAQRDEYKARFKTWMDTADVDAVVYPGFRSDVYDNDGAQTISSDRGTNVPTSNVGLPTLILPVGANPHGDPMSLQFVGRAFDDAKVLGFGYALEQQLNGAGHLLSPMAPALAYDANVHPTSVVIPPPIPPITGSSTEEPTEVALPAEVTTQGTTPGAGAGAASESAPSGASTTAPAMVIRMPKVVTVDDGKATLRFRNAGTTPVTGTVVLTRKVKVGKRTVTQVLGTATVSAAPGDTVTITVKLTKAGRKAARKKGGVKATAAFTLTPKGGKASSAKTTVTIG